MQDRAVTTAKAAAAGTKVFCGEGGGYAWEQEGGGRALQSHQTDRQESVQQGTQCGREEGPIIYYTAVHTTIYKGSK